MSTFANDPVENLSGTDFGIRNASDNLKLEISRALALKLNLKTQQHANEKMFCNLAKTGGRCILKHAV